MSTGQPLFFYCTCSTLIRLRTLSKYVHTVDVAKRSLTVPSADL
jgi:hypothetical protein